MLCCAATVHATKHTHCPHEPTSEANTVRGSCVLRSRRGRADFVPTCTCNTTSAKQPKPRACEIAQSPSANTLHADSVAYAKIRQKCWKASQLRAAERMLQPLTSGASETCFNAYQRLTQRHASRQPDRGYSSRCSRACQCRHAGRKIDARADSKKDQESESRPHCNMRGLHADRLSSAKQ